MQNRARGAKRPVDNTRRRNEGQRHMDDGDELRSVESETRSAEDVMEKPHAPSKSACQARPKAERIEWSHNLQV